MTNPSTTPAEAVDRAKCFYVHTLLERKGPLSHWDVHGPFMTAEAIQTFLESPSVLQNGVVTALKNGDLDWKLRDGYGAPYRLETNGAAPELVVETDPAKW